MKKLEPASLAGWLRATLTLPEEGSEGKDGRFVQRWGVESCTHCGRTILLGEKMMRLRIGGQRVALCALCEESLRAQHFERAA